MSFFSRIALLLMLLILSMTSFDSVGGFTFLRKRAYIKIFNDLGRGLDLVAHCKSDDDDLGAQLIKYPDGVLQFNFRPNAKGTTLFYCKFNWSNVSLWFDIYVFDRDHPQCSKCFWKVRPAGPCKLDYASGEYDICYPWNKQSL